MNLRLRIRALEVRAPPRIGFSQRERRHLQSLFIYIRTEDGFDRKKLSDLPEGSKELLRRFARSIDKTNPV
jgi:hypothetical protein